ncbi:MAG: trypsin-like peptidase domain-containing protein [Lachnospiraceae bacterium]|nr:trypsin-like peptidase domain-containing protein [Lachnospiraceae bacterium]
MKKQDKNDPQNDKKYDKKYDKKNDIRRRLLVLVTAVFLMGCGRREITLKHTPLLSVEHPEEENMAGLWQDAAAGAMVQIVAGEHVGSGVLWRQEGDDLYIATAAHVIAGGTESVKVLFPDDWETEIEEWWLSANADVAFLRVKIGNITGEQAETYMLVSDSRESYDRLEAGDGIILMASVRGVAEDAYDGSILEPWIYMEDYNQYMMYMKVPAYEGMSGGGVFDTQGHMLGIFSGVALETEGEGEGEVPEGAAVPLDILLIEFENYKKN